MFILLFLTLIVSNKVFYNITLTFKWTTANFPTDYPAGGHIPNIAAWSHKPTTFLNIRTEASAGTKLLAETGNSDLLEDEFKQRITNGEGLF